MAFLQEGRVRELAEGIRARCVQAHQLKMAGQQQSTTTANIQVSLAEDMQKRLRQAVQTLQEAIRDSTLAGVQQRLQVVAHKLGLKFDSQGSGGTASFFLSCDAFFTEVVCQERGTVSAVKLIQANNQEESEVLVQLLRGRKFGVFEEHLRALTELYSQTSSPADRAHMCRALSATESILKSISDSSPQSRASAVIMDNPLGFVSPRSGGLAMKLTFFVLPIDVLKHPHLEQVRAAGPQGVGVAAQVLVEKSSQVNHLCVDPNLFNRSLANFYPLTSSNSAPLPLTFVFSLSSCVPVCGAVAEQLQGIVYGTEQPAPSSQHINEWISSAKFQEKEHFHGSTTSFVRLPGQQHFYRLPADLTGQSSVAPPHRGMLLQKVPFLHPVHIFSIVPLLRKQLVYNTLLGSILRPSQRHSTAMAGQEYVFDVATSAPEHITVSMAVYTTVSPDVMTLEFAIPNQNPTKPVVTVTPGSGQPAVMQARLSEITAACLSIPVTMRAAMNEPLLLGETANTLVQAHKRNMTSLDQQVASMC